MEVRRHYSNRKKTYQMLLKKVKKAVAIRKVRSCSDGGYKHAGQLLTFAVLQKDRLHLLRVCCNLDDDNNENSKSNNNKLTYITIPLTPTEYDHCVHIDRLIRAELATQTNVILCLARQQMAVLRLPRSKPWVDKQDAEGYPWGALYLAERALAMHEVLLLEDGVDCVGHSLHIVLDTYQALHAPRFRAMTQVLQTMQLLYPERLGKALIIHPPMWLRTLVNVLAPFLSPHTAERIVMVTKQLQCTAAVDQPAEDILSAWVRSKDAEAMQEIMQQQMAPNDLYYEPYDVVQQQPEQGHAVVG